MKRWVWVGVGALALMGGVVAVLMARSEAPSPAGTWEGLLAVPRAPIRFVLRLRASGGTWAGSVDVPGAKGLPLEGVRYHSPDLQFIVKAGPSTSRFQGRIQGERMTGRVSLGKKRYDVSLRRSPKLPRPGNRVQAWHQDLDYALDRFPTYDRSFTAATRARFRAAVRSLRAKVGTLTDEAILAGLGRAVALSGNAHTRLYLLRNRSALGRVPIAVYWFEEGLYVVGAVRRHEDLLRCRVSAVGGRPPVEVRAKVARLFAGNPSWVLYKSVYFLASPPILFGVGVSARRDRTRYTFRCGNKTLHRTLHAGSPKAKPRRQRAWRDLSPFSYPVDSGWVNALPRRTEAVPLYLRRPREHYWFEYLPAERTLYFQYNRAAHDPKKKRFSAFAKELMREIEAKPLERLVVDLRLNSGGDLMIASKTMRRLARHPKLRGRGRLFVIVGRTTFSAGISHVVQLKQHGTPVLVGEKVGDGLDTWSEGGNLVLPNSRLTLHFTTGFHGYTKIEYPSRRPYYLDLSVDHVDPDIPVGFAAKDHFAGRDRALEAALRRPVRGGVAP